MIVWMDMMYNFGCAQHDSADWLGPDTDCRGSAESAVMGWPASVKQIFSPLGGDVKHGSWLTGCAGVGNPCRQAFEVRPKKNKTLLLDRFYFYFYSDAPPPRAPCDMLDVHAMPKLVGC